MREPQRFDDDLDRLYESFSGSVVAGRDRADRRRRKDHAGRLAGDGFGDHLTHGIVLVNAGTEVHTLHFRGPEPVQVLPAGKRIHHADAIDANRVIGLVIQLMIRDVDIRVRPASERVRAGRVEFSLRRDRVEVQFLDDVRHRVIAGNQAAKRVFEGRDIHKDAADALNHSGDIRVVCVRIRVQDRLDRGQVRHHRSRDELVEDRILVRDRRESCLCEIRHD